MALRSAGRVLGRIALFALLALIAAELVLQAAARFAVDRAAATARERGTFRVLALGDSHTYGAGVSEEASYPWQLQQALDTQAPGAFVVINKGVPGFNTSMLRKRLPELVRRYDPDMVVLWVGINDSWNGTDADTAEASWGWLDAVASRLRVYRLIRVWRHDRKLERDVVSDRRRPSVTQQGERDGKTFGSISYGDVVEEVTVSRSEKQIWGDLQRAVERNYDAMVQWLRAAGIPVAFVEYPVNLHEFAVANRAMRSVAERYDVPSVRSENSVARLSQDQLTLTWGAHPNESMYHEIVVDLAPLVLAARGERAK